MIPSTEERESWSSEWDRLGDAGGGAHEPLYVSTSLSWNQRWCSPAKVLAGCGVRCVWLFFFFLQMVRVCWLLTVWDTDSDPKVTQFFSLDQDRTICFGTNIKDACAFRHGPDWAECMIWRSGFKLKNWITLGMRTREDWVGTWDLRSFLIC